MVEVNRRGKNVNRVVDDGTCKPKRAEFPRRVSRASTCTSYRTNNEALDTRYLLAGMMGMCCTSNLDPTPASYVLALPLDGATIRIVEQREQARWRLRPVLRSTFRRPCSLDFVTALDIFDRLARSLLRRIRHDRNVRAYLSRTRKRVGAWNNNSSIDDRTIVFLLSEGIKTTARPEQRRK